LIAAANVAAGLLPEPFLATLSLRALQQRVTEKAQEFRQRVMEIDLTLFSQSLDDEMSRFITEQNTSFPTSSGAGGGSVAEQGKTWQPREAEAKVRG